ncbi:MAG: DinB family protein [Candidatus Bathyarchaeota archaeon]|nr:MAG: DinB family protein [Candidatus Bathyarchaeota archaeon]
MEIERIKDQMYRTFYSDSWDAGSVNEILSGINVEEASSRPLEGRHSIWELMLHMEIWKRVARKALEGEKMGRISPEEDWPPMGDVSEEEWAREVEGLKEEHEALVGAPTHMSDEHLGGTLPRRSYTFYTLLQGVIHHDIYHLGQIAILKDKKE